MKKFLLKLLILAVSVVGIQITFARYVVPKITGITLGIPGIAALDKYLNARYKIIYFGDSVIRTISSHDTDKSSVVEMFADMRNGDTVGDVSSSAYHTGIFEAMVEYISTSLYRPEIIIVPVNLRSFSPVWDLQPRYQFEKEIFFLTHNSFFNYFSKPISILRIINTDTVTDEQFLKSKVYYGERQVGIVSEFEAEGSLSLPSVKNIKNIYIYDYMYGLNREHRKLKSLENLIDMALQSDLKVYVYITPIDHQNGTRYVGKDFAKQVAANAEIVCSILTDKDLPCLNMVSDLDPSYFDHPEYPSEHLNEKGRKFIAERVNNFFFNR